MDLPCISQVRASQGLSSPNDVTYASVNKSRVVDAHCTSTTGMYRVAHTSALVVHRVKLPTHQAHMWARLHHCEPHDVEQCKRSAAR